MFFVRTFLLFYSISLSSGIHGQTSLQGFNSTNGKNDLVVLNVTHSPLTGFFEQPIDRIDQNHTVEKEPSEPILRGNAQDITEPSKNQVQDIKSEESANLPTPESNSSTSVDSESEIVDKVLLNHRGKIKAGTPANAKNDSLKNTPDFSLTQTDDFISESNSSLGGNISLIEDQNIESNNSIVSEAEIESDPSALPFLTSDFFWVSSR